ncbi:MAG: hypothetical protein GXO87_02050, partial [Chlorobi bacterium]|nr:hypothetical protein [Chlorobiota bacterium]
MEFNPLFFQKGSDLGGEQILGKPQGLKNAGYLFSDLMKVHLNETTDGLLENVQQSILGNDFLNVESGNQTTLGVIDNITLSPNNIDTTIGGVQKLLANAGSLDVNNLMKRLHELLSAETGADQSSIDKLLKTIKNELDTKGTVVLSFPSAEGVSLISISEENKTTSGVNADASGPTLTINTTKISSDDLSELEGTFSQQAIEELTPNVNNKYGNILLLGLQPVKTSQAADLNLVNAALPQEPSTVQNSNGINLTGETAAAQNTNLTEAPLFTNEPDISIGRAVGKEAAQIHDLKTLQSKFSNELVSAKVSGRDVQQNILTSAPNDNSSNILSAINEAGGEEGIIKQTAAGGPAANSVPSSDNKQTKPANVNNTANLTQPTLEIAVEETANTLAGIPKGKTTVESNAFLRQTISAASSGDGKQIAQSIQPEATGQEPAAGTSGKNIAVKTSSQPNQTIAAEQTATKKPPAAGNGGNQAPQTNSSQEETGNAAQNINASDKQTENAQTQINTNKKSVPDLNTKPSNNTERTTESGSLNKNSDAQNKTTTENQTAANNKSAEKAPVENNAAQIADKSEKETSEQSPVNN